MKIPAILYCSIILFFSGCASIPNATIEYYLPKNTVSVTAIQTVSCANERMPGVETSVTFEESFSADFSRPREIELDVFETFYSSGAAEFTFTKDRRLVSLNSATTGAGSDIVDTILSIRNLQKEAPYSEMDGDVTPGDVESACKEINRFANKKNGVPQPLTLVLEGVVEFSSDGSERIEEPFFTVVGFPSDFYSRVNAVLGRFSVAVTRLKASSITLDADASEDRSLELVEPAPVAVTLLHTTYRSDGSTIALSKNLHAKAVSVPQWGVEYRVPIPRPPLFGKNDLILSLFESGAIKSIKYGSSGDVEGLKNAVSSLEGSLVKTDEQKAKELKDRADVIANQQRLLGCQEDRENCK